MRRCDAPSNKQRTLRTFEQLEDRLLLSGRGVAFFVSGFEGSGIPEAVRSHLVEIVSENNALNARGLDWDKDGDGYFDIYATNWNSPNPRTDTGNPGHFAFEVSESDSFFGTTIPKGLRLSVIEDPSPESPEQFIASLTNTLDTEYDDDDFVLLVGKSLGGNSVLEVANRTVRQIDLLVTLDPVGWTNEPDDASSYQMRIFEGVSVDVPDWAGGGEYEVIPPITAAIPMDEIAATLSGFKDPVRGRPGYRKDLPSPSQDNVQYLYNRWQEKFPFPLDYDRSGHLDDSHIQRNISADFSYDGQPISVQARRNNVRDEDFNETKHSADFLDVLFGYSHISAGVSADFGSWDNIKFPPDVSGSLGFSETSVMHHDGANGPENDPFINAELKALLDQLVPQAPTVSAGATQWVDEGDIVSLAGSFSDANPLDTHTVRWEQLSGPHGVALSSTTGLTPTFVPGDNGIFTFQLTVEDSSGLSAVSQVTIVVRNVAPTVSPISGLSRYVRGFPMQFSTTFSDPGVLDTHDAAWNFGDGTGLAYQSTTIPGSLAPQHLFTNKGTYSVTAAVRDDDLGVGVSPVKTVEVLAAGLVPNPDNPALMDLLVGGTLDADTITIQPEGAAGDVRVIIEGELDEVFTPTGDIKVAGQAGSDTITILPGLVRPVFVYGGDDADVININGSSATSPVKVFGDQGR